MCNTSLHQRNFNNLVEPFSFSTFHFLRTRNRLMLPPNAEPSPYYNLLKDGPQVNPSQLDTILHHNYETAKTPPTSPILDVIDNSTLEHIPAELENSLAACLQQNETTSSEKSLTKTQDSPRDNGANLLQQSSTAIPGGLGLPNINILPLPGSTGSMQPSLPAFEYLTPAARNLSPVDFPLMELNRGGIFPSFLHRRPRGEKRPIPDEQKDDKYYERRKRNNEAAKKSRDARKIREDRIAFRAAFLEQENSLLRAQVMAMRDELQTMRQILSRNNLNQATLGAAAVAAASAGSTGLL
ncbi:thyrotroph embryonic factor [Musca vetustissima]|uniref:thyrotroph embryonic factor n=1 Tax=Musca vetustissima TaxID=27455 RepID=UPI002AB70611|nr:thyrotroph embryonic factor [Musca vetustissima]